MKIKKLKPTDGRYLLRDNKVLVNEKKGIVIGRGDSLMKHIDNRGKLDFLLSDKSEEEYDD